MISCERVAFEIRRPWPSPRQGRRLGPPEVWNLLCHSLLLLRHSSLPLPGFKRLQLLKPSKSLELPATKPLHKRSKPLQPSNCCTASSRQLPPSPLIVTLCCSTCPLPAHPSRQLPPSSWPSAFQHCSLPFACTQPSLVRAFKPAVCQASNLQNP